MTKIGIRIALAWLIACTAAAAQGAPDAPSRNSMKLSLVIMALPAGAP
jgi:hypothetical protein